MSTGAAIQPDPKPAVARPFSQRDVYRETLFALASRDQRVWCVDTDTGWLKERFRDSLRYVDLGIAEANAMSVAAGLAATGKIPFVNTMASFASTRACEQVKLDIAYNNLPVKIVGTHGGLSGGHFGPTHHALEDLAIMRSLPNMTVIVPADAAETAEAVASAVQVPGPVYIRLGRSATDAVYQNGCDFKVGRASRLRSGTGVTLLACGPHPVLIALAAHDRLLAHGVTATVLNAATLKPLDEIAILESAAVTGAVVTIEEHSVIGGLGGAVAELLSERLPCPLRRVGVRDVFCEVVGPPELLLRVHEITVDAVVEDALSHAGSRAARGRHRREATR